MSRAATLLPPLPRLAARSGAVAARAPWGEAAAPSSLDVSRAEPRPQRDASLSAEAATEVGPAHDAHEQEADAIARMVMRMPATIEPREAEAGVQRACAACEAEETVQRRSVEEAERAEGPPDLAASPARLTSGGAPLGAELRGFYESRLGRDLSSVRIHQGAPAEAMAESISARAFTYGSHIWLGRGEGAAPTETFSHEMAHVLQQTQPAALGNDAAEAGPAAPAAQRSARWVPLKPGAGEKDFEKSRGSAHNAVVVEVSEDKRNTELLAEVPIPSAGRYSAEGNTPGYADFFKADPSLRLPGVTVAKDPAAKAPALTEEEKAEAAEDAADDAEPPQAASATPTAPPDAPKPGAPKPTLPAPPDQLIANFDEADWAPGWGADYLKKNPDKTLELATPMKGGKPMAVAGHQHPRIIDGKIQGVPLAPKTIALGELKPGHNIEAGEKGFRKQLPRYRRALNKVKDAVNAVDPARRDGTWALEIKDIRGQGGGITGLHIPPGLHPKAARPKFTRTLELRINGKPLPTATEVSGHLAVGPHPTLPGIWSYAWVPANAPRAQTLTAGQRASVKKLEKQLRGIIAQLKTTPTKVKRRHVTQARRMVRRNPKPRGDSFKLNAWEAERESLAANYKSTDPAAIQTIERQQAVREAFKEIAEEMKGVSAPPASAQQTADLKLLHRLERVTDPKFGPLLGTLREKFGTVFVRLANAYDGFREKLAERTKRAPSGPPSGFEGPNWKKKAIRLLIGAATVGARLLMEQVAQNFAGCIDGLADQLVAKFEGELDERFGEQIEAIITAFDDLRARIETELEPFLAQLDALFAMLQDAGKLASLIGDMVTLARVGLQAASCLSPPLAGCLWGLAGQLGIEGALHIAVDQQWFKESVINPIARELVQPFADDAYKMILNLLLGDPDTKTLRGTLADMVAKTPACAVPTRAQMFGWSGGDTYVPVTDAASAAKAARGTAEEWHKGSAAEIDKAVKDLYRNADGTPASDEQIAALLDQMEKSGLQGQELRHAVRSGRKKGGGIDPELARIGVEDSVGPDTTSLIAPPGAAAPGPSPSSARLERGDSAFTGPAQPADWYGVLRTPLADRRANAAVVLDLYFPHHAGLILTFTGLSVTFLETYKKPGATGEAEQDWLHFSIAKPVYLKSAQINVNITAGDWHIQLAAP